MADQDKEIGDELVVDCLAGVGGSGVGFGDKFGQLRRIVDEEGAVDEGVEVGEFAH